MSDVAGISGLALPGAVNLAAPSAPSASPLMVGQSDQQFQQLLADGPGKQETGVSREAKAAKEFETMVISSFLSDAFKSANSTTFGEGFQGEFYAQIFTRSVAERIVESGGFGIAAMIEKR